ncbi:hypothetical protein CRENBAI_014685 [Crenichthys baileyi]|uniref:Uncharacterized protein n=1 Tax=Crenichthys baileyi TaxID=28760 RepID=A0AAV9RRC2_9TELE
MFVLFSLSLPLPPLLFPLLFVLDEKASPGAPEDDGKLSARPRLQRGGSSASLHNSLMRNSIFQLMIHTLDPLSEEFADSELGTYGKLKYYHSMTEEGKFREKASILHKIAKKKCQVEDSEKANGVASRAEKNLPNSSSVEVEEVTPPMNGTAGQEGETHAPPHLRLDLPKTRPFPQSSVITVLANLQLATAGCCKRDLFDKRPHAEPHLAGATTEKMSLTLSLF